MARVRGKIKWFNNLKGYGFIDTTGGDVFVHYAAIKSETKHKYKTLEAGDVVEFEIRRNPRGPQADEVILVKDEVENDQDVQQNSDYDGNFLGLALIEGKIRVVSITPDGKYQCVDETQNIHNILYLMTSETLSLKLAVEELEDLMNTPKAKEKEFQDFFERNPDFILSDEYKEAHPHIVLAKDEDSLIPDFILEPIEQNSLCDILELKLPSVSLFVLKKNRMRYSSAILEVCAQLRTYGQFFEAKENRERFEISYPNLKVYKPKMVVIIGRHGKESPFVKRDIQTDLPNLILRTYDDVLNRMKWKVEAMKKGKLRNLL